MRRIALRGLVARKARAGLTALAVLIGVTMISGTLVYTDTINQAFRDLFESSTSGSDAIVTGRQDIGSPFAEPTPIPRRVVDRVRGLDAVLTASGQVSEPATVVDKRGEVIRGSVAGVLAVSYLPEPFQELTLEEGRLPRGGREAAIDPEIAEAGPYEVGDRIPVSGAQPQRRFTVTGIARFGGGGVSGTPFVVFDLPTAQKLLGRGESVDYLAISGTGQAEAPALVREISRVLPNDLVVRTASEQVDQNLEQLGEGLGVLTSGLLAFGVIAVFVGGFVIFNTFAITVAQRTREFALLRVIGASRRQILTLVLLEAAVIGLFVSAAGVAAGLLLAEGITALFEALDFALPTTDAVLTGRTVVVALGVGTLITVGSSLIPALRATRVTPLEAMRDSAAPPRRGTVRRLAILASILLGLLGAYLLATGLLYDTASSDSRLASSAGVAVLLVLGLALLTPRIVRPAASVVGWPLQRLSRFAGRLARLNATRNPGRTAATSSALTIGLALVLFVAVFADGLRASTTEIIDRTFGGDFVIQNQDGFSPIPASSVRAAAITAGVRTVSPFKLDETRVRGAGRQTATGIDPSTVGEVYSFDWEPGSSDASLQLAGNEVLVERDTALELGVDVGDEVVLDPGGGGRETLRVRGVYRDDALLSGVALSLAAHNRIFRQRKVSTILVAIEEGADRSTIGRQLAAALERYPEVESLSQQGLKDRAAEQVDQVLVLFTALLAMSVLVALLGIVNTLTLSVHERRRELGLLRAVGMDRRGVRRLVRYESVMTAAIGSALGILLGIFFAWVVTRALGDEGIVFSVPWGQVVLLLVAGLVAGVLAAVLPARRASRVDVLAAIAHE